MKEIIRIGLAALLLTSCNVLDLEPVSQISTNQAFKDINSAQGVVNGMFNNLQAVYDWRVQVISDVASDVSQQIDTWDALVNIDEFNTTPDNSEVSDLYTILYRCIDIANNIIEKVPPLAGNQIAKDDMVGQAYFVRAMAYFELARFWGGMPQAYQENGVVIKLTPSAGISPDDFAPRTSLTDTYKQVERDLLRALVLLPQDRNNNVQNRARPTQATVKALLARYYLYQQDWAKAEAYATAVMLDARFQLVKPFENIFRTKNTTEAIFEIQYSSNDPGGLRNWYFPASQGGRGGVALHEEFYQQMIADTNDVRGALTATNTAVGTHYTTKWNTPSNTDNVQVIRIAEMYLIRAEAHAEQNNINEAKEDLNAIRTRAGLGNTLASTQDELINAILEERKLEFAAEGQRWFDLIRKGRALTTLSHVKRSKGSQPFYALEDPRRQLFPFPTIEVLTNTNLKQNSAYQ